MPAAALLSSAPSLAGPDPRVQRLRLALLCSCPASPLAKPQPSAAGKQRGRPVLGSGPLPGDPPTAPILASHFVGEEEGLEKKCPPSPDSSPHWGQQTCLDPALCRPLSRPFEWERCFPRSGQHRLWFLHLTHLPLLAVSLSLSCSFSLCLYHSQHIHSPTVFFF